MTAKLAIGAALCVGLALPVSALTPSPDCEFDFKTGTLEYAAQGTGEGVFRNTEDGQFVTWFVYGPEPMEVYPGIAAMEDCASQKTVRVTFGKKDRKQVYETFESMVYGDTGYTMAQIASEMKRLRADVDFGQANLGPCGCGRKNG